MVKLSVKYGNRRHHQQICIDKFSALPLDLSTSQAAEAELKAKKKSSATPKNRFEEEHGKLDLIPNY